MDLIDPVMIHQDVDMLNGQKIKGNPFEWHEAFVQLFGVAEMCTLRLPRDERVTKKEYTK